jgi:predicted nucleotidyltransferase
MNPPPFKSPFLAPDWQTHPASRKLKRQVLPFATGLLQMLAKLTPEQLAACAEVFRSEPEVLAAWLFGSVAKGRANPFSDIDFAVLLRPNAPKGLDRFVLLDRLAQALANVLAVSEHDVDVTALNEHGVLFEYEVLRSGQMLHEADRQARELFAWGVVCRYLDFRPTLDIFDRASGRLRGRAPAHAGKTAVQSSGEKSGWG